MLIAEQLLLLILDDQSGKFVVDRTKTDFGLAGGVLVELVQLGKVDIAGADDAVKKGRLVVLNSVLTGDVVLDTGLLEIMNRAGKRPSNALGAMKKDLRKTLIARLVEAGVIRAEEGKVLGIFPSHRWPANANGVHAALERSLSDVLTRGIEPDPRTAALIGLLHAMGAASKVVPTDDRRALKRRAREIAQGQWAPEAVRKAIEATESAAAGAVVATMGGGSF